MAYSIQLGDQIHRVEVVQETDRLEVVIDQERFPIDVTLTAPRVYSLLINGRSYEIDVQDLGDQHQVHVDGRAFVVQVVDEKRRRAGGAAAFEGENLISAVMPGKVVRLLVQVGDAVKKGQGIIVIEAMKMENELKAPCDGEVKQILAEEGQAVKARDGLVLIE